MEFSDQRVQGSAVLIFADLLAADLAVRGWSHRRGGLLSIPAFDPVTLQADIHLFTPSRIGSFGSTSESGGYCIHRQVGRSFAERLENAVAQLARLGYEKIVVVGRDCPDLDQSDVAGALRSLDWHRLVLGPDHKGGCYLIALRAGDRHLLSGIRWRCDTDCATLRDRAGAGGTLLLPMKVDLDGDEDLRLIPRLRDWLSSAVGLRLAARAMPPLSLAYLMQARHWQLPPPMAA